jgi:Arc/MetJ-type ribon-helix-helix transcriptional regulator
LELLELKEGEKTEKYATISLPLAIMKAVDELINDLGYWPSRGAFVREACLEKIHEERRRLKELKETKKDEGT